LASVLTSGSFTPSKHTPSVSVLFILVIASLLVAGCALAAFLWAVKDGQMEDTKASAMRVLNDD
jgi:cbb3-type cytochrome oxidase maturation protein